MRSLGSELIGCWAGKNRSEPTHWLDLSTDYQDNILFRKIGITRK